MSYVVMNDGAAPATPATGKSTLYTAAGGRLHCINGSGSDYLVGGSAPDNFIRNGGFWFAQRQTPATPTTYSSTAGRAITADGWGIGNENASVNFARIDTSASPVTGIPGRYYGQFTKITATGKLALSQVIENGDCMLLRGRNVRFTVWASADSATQWQLGLLALGSGGTIDTIPATFISAYGANGTDPTLGTNLTYTAPTTGKTGDNCTAGTNSYACSLTTTFQRFSGVFTVPANCLNVIPILYSNSQVTLTTGKLNITHAMLTDGEQIYEFSNQGMGPELQRVCRFYQKSFALDTAPAQNVGANTGEFHFSSPNAGAIAMAGIGITYPVRMFKAGVTNTLYSPSSASAQIRNVTDAADLTASAVTANGETGMWLNATGTAGTAVGENLAVHWTSDAEL